MKRRTPDIMVGFVLLALTILAPAILCILAHRAFAEDWRCGHGVCLDADSFDRRGNFMVMRSSLGPNTYHLAVNCTTHELLTVPDDGSKANLATFPDDSIIGSICLSTKELGK